MALEDIRKQIDEVDGELTALFCRRMDLVGQVAEAKKAEGVPQRQRERERAILARAAAQAGPYAAYARLLYTTLFDVSCAYQGQLTAPRGKLTEQIRRAVEETPALFPTGGTVACQGAEGAYSAQACDKLFPAAEVTWFRSFEHVCDAVESGLCRFGILPIENSSNGSVSSVYELMKEKRFHIVRSTRLSVRHQLLALPGVELADIREIASHEQAIGQCSRFLNGLRGVRITPAANTALAAKELAASGRRDLAVIAAPQCGELYGLRPVAENVQNNDNNHTRFICIEKELRVYPGADRISLMLSAPHRPGGLYELIGKFAALGLNLTKLESRPIAGSDFEFLFYFDLMASVRMPEVPPLLEELAAGCDTFAFLGNYAEVV